MNKQADTKVRMLKPVIVRYGDGDDNTPTLKITPQDPETRQQRVVTVNAAIAKDWVESGIAEYTGKAPTE